MNTVSEPASSSLAQRIAKVRNCILVEVSTDVSVTDKDLFVSLCQWYEQNSVERPCTDASLSQNPLDQASDLTSESILPDGLAATSERDSPPRQHRIGFSVLRLPHFEGFENWEDWYDRG